MVFLLYSSVPRILWLPFWVASFLSACARSTSFVSLVMLVVELFHLKPFPSLLQCSLLSIGRCVERRSARTWTSRLHTIPTPTFSKDLFEDISSNSSDKKKKASLTCYSLNYRTELPARILGRFHRRCNLWMLSLSVFIFIFYWIVAEWLGDI